MAADHDRERKVEPLAMSRRRKRRPAAPKWVPITSIDEKEWRELVEQAKQHIEIRAETDERAARGWFNNAGISNAIETNRRRH